MPFAHRSARSSRWISQSFARFRIPPAYVVVPLLADFVAVVVAPPARSV